MSQVQASSRVATTFEFECACGYAGEAAVQGEGFATVDAGHDLFPVRGVQQSALDHAEGLAWADALTTVELAPCPRCGERSAARWRQFTWRTLPVSLAWGVLGGAIALLGTFLLRARLDSWPLLVGGLVLPLLVVGHLGWRLRRKWSRSRALSFEPSR